MFGRLDKFDGLIFGVSIYGGQGGGGGGGGWLIFGMLIGLHIWGVIFVSNFNLFSSVVNMAIERDRQWR